MRRIALQVICARARIKRDARVRQIYSSVLEITPVSPPLIVESARHARRYLRLGDLSGTGDGMRSCLIQSAKPHPWLRIGFVGALILTLSGWTCTAIIGFSSCLGVPATPQITLLSPSAVSVTADSVVLTVTGSGFVPQSQILWNGNALLTTFIDSQRLQATITQQTFAQFGGAFGSNVLISVNSPVTATVVGCPIAGSSTTMVLGID